MDINGDLLFLKKKEYSNVDLWLIWVLGVLRWEVVNWVCFSHVSYQWDGGFANTLMNLRVL
jgi:hypothetical protein